METGIYNREGVKVGPNGSDETGPSDCYAIWDGNVDGPHPTWHAAAQRIPYPRTRPDGRTVWACCESSIGPKCQHSR